MMKDKNSSLSSYAVFVPKRLRAFLIQPLILLKANRGIILQIIDLKYAKAERDLEILTGVKVAHSTQHRLVNRYQLPEPQITKRAKSLSIDGGTVRLRTPLGKQSEWKNYKAVKIHGRMGMAFFQDNESLLQWVNQQPLSQNGVATANGQKTTLFRIILII